MAQERNTRRGSLPISGGQFLIVITLVIGIYFALDLSRQIVVTRRLGLWQKELAAEVAALEAEIETLRRQREEVKTDAYVERVAREEFRWVRPGDVLVVPVSTTPSSQADFETPVTVRPQPEGEQPTTESRLQRWWKRLFPQ